MSDFVQTMMDWRRMCKAYSTDDESCCYGCPVVDFREYGCGAIFEMEDSTDWERYEGAIREWVAEHPEPVYPSWAEWLHSQSLAHFDSSIEAQKISDKYRETSKDVPGIWVLTAFARSPIPADIAQKLEIKPKEEV